MIKVVLPAHLRTLARVDGDVELDVNGRVTQRAVLDALESRYPVLRGTIRDHVTHKRRAFVRFFACEEDQSHESPDGGRTLPRRRRARGWVIRVGATHASPLHGLSADRLGGAREQQLAFARVAGERGRALELGAGFVRATELREQIAPHAR
jgi:molybdopterin synthase sulfur carrier subunit